MTRQSSGTGVVSGRAGGTGRSGLPAQRDDDQQERRLEDVDAGDDEGDDERQRVADQPARRRPRGPRRRGTRSGRRGPSTRGRACSSVADRRARGPPRACARPGRCTTAPPRRTGRRGTRGSSAAGSRSRSAACAFQPRRVPPTSAAAPASSQASRPRPSASIAGDRIGHATSTSTSWMAPSTIRQPAGPARRRATRAGTARPGRARGRCRSGTARRATGRGSGRCPR